MPFYPFEITILYHEVKSFSLTTGFLSLFLSISTLFLAKRQWRCIPLKVVSEEDWRKMMANLTCFLVWFLLALVYFHHAATFLIQSFAPHLVLVSVLPHSVKMEMVSTLSQTLLHEVKVTLAAKGSLQAFIGFALLYSLFFWSYQKPSLTHFPRRKGSVWVSWVFPLIGNAFLGGAGSYLLWLGLCHITGLFLSPHYMLLLNLS